MENSKTPTSRDLQAIKRRKELLVSAKTLFAKNGFHNTSVRDIIEHAGIASGLIYHYFPKGKQEMLNTIIEEGHEIIVNSAEETLKNIQSNKITLRDGLITIGNSMTKLVLSDTELTQIMLREHNFIEPDCMKYMQNYLPKLIIFTQELLEEKAAKGEIKIINSKMAIVLLVSAFNFATITEVLNTPIPGMKFEISEVVDYLLELWKP